MNELNQLFTGFSTLFDPQASPEDKACVKASIQSRVENNLELINRVAMEKDSINGVTIHYKKSS